jgi:hypothetical protein
VNFFDGQLLSADDLRAEQDYHRGMRYLHNRLLHGWGVVEGFAVDGDDGGVRVGPGVAIDPLGRELVLPAPAHVDLPPEAAVHDQTPWSVVVTWEEAPSAPVADGGGTSFSRWVERCALSMRRDAPEDAGPGLLLATVLAVAGNVTGVDTSRRKLLGVAQGNVHAAAQPRSEEDRGPLSS